MTHGIRKSSLKPQKSLTIPELAAMEIFRLHNPFFMTAEKDAASTDEGKVCFDRQQAVVQKSAIEVGMIRHYHGQTTGENGCSRAKNH